MNSDENVSTQKEQQESLLQSRKDTDVTEEEGDKYMYTELKGTKATAIGKASLMSKLFFTWCSHIFKPAKKG